MHTVFAFVAHVSDNKSVTAVSREICSFYPFLLYRACTEKGKSNI